MFLRFSKIAFISKIFLILFLNFAYSDVVKTIEITGNERISKNTIKMFSEININQNLNQSDINSILKRLYETNFFENIEVEFQNSNLKIIVKENPIIEKIVFSGIKAEKIKKAITKNMKLKSRSSYNEILLKKDKDEIQKTLKQLGYYFSRINILIEELEDNKIVLNYDIDIGNKSKIKKITFIGNKIFKDSKLRSIIVSEEYKFWKFISGRKFLNENTINLDKNLLKNFYLSKGYYNVSINSSFAKLIQGDDFELIFSIEPNQKFFFNKLNLELPDDFNDENFKDLNKLFKEITGEPYSINYVSKILDEIDLITTNEEYHSIKATVEEEIIENKINLKFKIFETEKFFVEKINIYGNNVTKESVIRNNLEIDEGDPFNEILSSKSTNNLKGLNFFKEVKSEIVPGSTANTKIINYILEEKPTGEISAGAGVGTSGGTVGFSVKENNYLGKGISLEANTTLTEESIKGLLSVSNPNYKNTNKSINFSLQATEIDKLTDYGYKTDKFGFSLGTDFEFLSDLNVGVATSSFYEKIETNSSASARQKKLAGNYWDTFIRFNFDYDKRNQFYQTTDGFRSRYFLDLPVISDTNTLTNTYDYKVFTELFEQNVSTASFFIKTANSISNDDIKLSERLNIPSSKLRGFERGKVGPKDGNDYIGGNYISAVNFTSTIPQILENAQNVDVAVFFDAANVWGVDYNSSLDNSKIRSSVGVGVDWFTVIGPLNFSFAIPLSKDTNDQTETFRFNIGTSF